MDPQLVTGICASVSLIGLCYIFFRRRNSRDFDDDKNRVMTLYYFPMFRSSRCLWLIYELGIQDKIIQVEYNPQDPDKEKVKEYRSYVHPNGTVPALEIQGREPILESGAICLYLARLYGNLLPSDDQMDTFYNWIMVACCTVDEILEHIFHELNRSSREPDKVFIRKQMDRFKVFSRVFSEHMESRDFVCGEKFTVADCIIGYNVWWASKMLDGDLLQEFPPLQRYLERLQSRPGYSMSTLD